MLYWFYYRYDQKIIQLKTAHQNRLTVIYCKQMNYTKIFVLHSLPILFPSWFDFCTKRFMGRFQIKKNAKLVAM